MNREDYIEEILNLAKTRKNLLIQWPTGVGKSRCALEVIKGYCIGVEKIGVVFPKFLIVVPKLVLINNWKEEIKRWLGEESLSFFTYTTYVSFYKTMDYYWNCIVFDECHHFTERCAECFIPERTERVIGLSATVKREVKLRLNESIPNLFYHKISTRTVIDGKILPDPRVFLVPLYLNKLSGNFTYVKNPKGVGKFRINYESRWKFLKRKECVEIICTAEQCHSLYCEEVSFWEKQFKRTQQLWAKNKWLRVAGERLKWLSDIKTPLIRDILMTLDKCRTLTFCSSIEQTEKVGKNNIHSKNGDEGIENLNKFNEGIINHITCVNILNEGVNLSNCQVGIFAGLTASEVAQTQKLGRVLRHKHPLIILPYFTETRDEEIVDKMKRDYNPSLVETVSVGNLRERIEQFISDETGY